MFKNQAEISYQQNLFKSKKEIYKFNESKDGSAFKNSKKSLTSMTV